jgi:hypothetical protein
MCRIAGNELKNIIVLSPVKCATIFGGEGNKISLMVPKRLGPPLTACVGMGCGYADTHTLIYHVAAWSLLDRSSVEE